MKSSRRFVAPLFSFYLVKSISAVRRKWNKIKRINKNSDAKSTMNKCTEKTKQKYKNNSNVLSTQANEHIEILWWNLQASNSIKLKANRLKADLNNKKTKIYIRMCAHGIGQKSWRIKAFCLHNTVCIEYTRINLLRLHKFI